MKPYGKPGKVIDKPGNRISRSAARRKLKKSEKIDWEPAGEMKIVPLSSLEGVKYYSLSRELRQL